MTFVFGELELDPARRELRANGKPQPLQPQVDGPVRAIRCACAVAEASPVSFGVHTGQVVRKGATVDGPAFEVAEAVADQAPTGQVWASRVLVDLVPGADLSFTETGRTVSAQGREISLFSAKEES